MEVQMLRKFFAANATQRLCTGPYPHTLLLSLRLQHLSLPLLDMDFIRRDTWALQRHFKKKRDFLLRELSALGITVTWKPTATFYIWADLSALPHPLSESIHQCCILSLFVSTQLNWSYCLL